MEKAYDVGATWYEKRSLAADLSAPWLVLEKYLVEVGANKEFTAIDIGAGPGVDASVFGQKTKISFFASDLSYPMCKLASKRVVSICSDIAALGFKNEVFDLVTCVATLHHAPSLVVARNWLSELERITKKGGIIVLSTELLKNTSPRFEDSPWGPKRWFLPLSQEDLTDMLEVFGLQVKVIQTNQTHRPFITILATKPFGCGI